MAAPEFLKVLPERMNEGIHDDPRIEVVAGGPYSEGYRLVIGKAVPSVNGSKGEAAYPIGAAWYDGHTWYATMGSCWVGTYPNWKEALGNIIIAYYG